MKGKEMMSIGMADCSLGVEGAKVMVEIASVMTSLTSATSTTYQGLNSQPICTTIEGARGCISSCIDDPLILELIRPPVYLETFNVDTLDPLVPLDVQSGLEPPGQPWATPDFSDFMSNQSL